MSPALFLLIAAAGGAGSAVRFLVDGLVRDRVGSRTPWATALINLAGSFALGFVTGAAASGTLTPAWLAVLGSGFLGGFTTFSTASVETVRLLQQRRPKAGLAYALGVLVLAVALAALGGAVGRTR